MGKPEKKHSASFFVEAPVREHDYRDNALTAIGELGSNGQFVVPLGVLGPFSQWLGWPDWLRKGTSLTGDGMLPQRISIADYIMVIANCLEHGYGSELIKKTLQANRLIAGPRASIIIRNAPNLGQGLMHLTSLFGATNMKLSIQFVTTGRWAEVNIVQKLPLGAILDFVATIRLILVMRSIEWFLLNDLRPAVLTLTLPHDQSIESLLREQGVDVVMGATSNRLTFPSDWLKRPNSDYDASLWRIALQHLRKAEEGKWKRDLATRLRSQIATHLATHGKVLRLKELAAREGVAVRTLSRKLAETGVKFQEIVDQERKEFVAALIAEKSVSLTDVARMSGYSNISSFGRAFQKWHGQSPGVYRDALNQHINS